MQRLQLLALLLLASPLVHARGARGGRGFGSTPDSIFGIASAIVFVAIWICIAVIYLRKRRQRSRPIPVSPSTPQQPAPTSCPGCQRTVPDGRRTCTSYPFCSTKALKKRKSPH